MMVQDNLISVTKVKGWCGVRDKCSTSVQYRPSYSRYCTLTQPRPFDPPAVTMMTQSSPTAMSSSSYKSNFDTALVTAGHYRLVECSKRLSTARPTPRALVNQGKMTGENAEEVRQTAQ